MGCSLPSMVMAMSKSSLTGIPFVRCWNVTKGAGNRGGIQAPVVRELSGRFRPMLLTDPGVAEFFQDQLTRVAA